MNSCFSKNGLKPARVNVLLTAGIFLLLSFRTDNTEVILGPEPKGLPEIDTARTTLTWTKVIKAHHEWLEYAPYQKSDTTLEMRRNLYVAAFGSIYAWWEEPYPADKNHGFGDQAVYKQFAGAFYKSKSLRRLIYDWIKPMYVASYKKMPGWKKTIYRDLLYDTKNYVHNFNYEAALKNYKEGHAPVDPNYRSISPVSVYRMQSWVFRRVHNKQMSRKEIEYWADRMIMDLREIERGEN